MTSFPEEAMGRRALVQSRARLRTTVAAALAAAVAAGAAPAPFAAAADEPVPEHVVFANDRYVPRAEALYGAGVSGVLHKREGTSGMLWTRWDGTTVAAPVPLASPSPVITGTWLFGATDTVISQGSTLPLRATDLETGASYEFALPEGHTAVGYVGNRVLTRTGAAGAYTHHLLAWDGAESFGAVAEVAAPAGYTVTAVLAADARQAVVRYADTEQRSRFGLVDLETGAFTAGPVAVGSQVTLTPTRLVWASGGTTLSWVPRADLSAAVTQRTVPPQGGANPVVGAAGDSVFVAWKLLSGSLPDLVDQSGMRLQSVTLSSSSTGTQPVDVLRHAATTLVTAADGRLVVAGGTDSGHWALRTIAPDTATPTALADVPPVPARLQSISLANGTFATADADGHFQSTYVTRKITTTGPGLGVGPKTIVNWQFGQPAYTSAGDGRAVFVSTSPEDTTVDDGISTDDAGFFRAPSSGGRLTEVTGRYAIVNGADPAQQYIGDLAVHLDLLPILTRSVTASSVWGSELWAPSTTTPGKVSAIDLKKKTTTTTVLTGAPCVAKELQVVGRWMYWSCGAGQTAGVYDRNRGTSFSVPTDVAQLGDGYLASYHSASHELRLTEFADGTPSTRVVDTLSSGARGVRWTVDKFGGPVAYIADDQSVHLAPSGVPTQPIAVTEWDAGTFVNVQNATVPWRARWQLSKPGSGWTLTFRSRATGAVVRTISGSTGGQGLVSADWDGKDAAGKPVANGSYTWTVTVSPADGQGAPAMRSGTVSVSGGLPVRHDHIWSDGVGDLLTLNSYGTFTFQVGTGTGGFQAKFSGGGWPTSATAVPFGDMDGDRCNEVLVRLSSGALRAYKPRCGKLATSSAYTSLGSGWELYNALTSPGDMTGDGRADLLARGAKTGTLYLFPGTADGKLGARKVVRTSWSGFSHIVGAGDLNGDGIGDVLARSTGGKLYRCYGRADGTLGSGVVLWSDWGASYKDVVVVGDITGDGKADLVVRDKYGNLYRNAGTGNGTFGGRVKIATGWQGYKGVF
ncbi:FG-GAP-like repeat-containing protein [Streptomyces sp. NPDC051940]|uniref:FG-GAP-like repeat-containing protein n=1 Tax=Streptomyces sp. NPDC051940 TaxID=3155675 RepID=UPI00342F0525